MNRFEIENCTYDRVQPHCRIINTVVWVILLNRIL